VPPPSARFKGYASYAVQDLVIRPHVIEFYRQLWRAADGRMVTVPLPQGIAGHFGPHLCGHRWADGRSDCSPAEGTDAARLPRVDFGTFR
jgi:hypothetical protein